MTDYRIVQALAGAAHGGAENFYFRLCLSLAEQGCQQHLLTRLYPHRQQQLSNANLEATHIDFAGRLNLWEHWRYRQQLKQLKPDLVMTWMNRATINTPKGDYRLVARLGHYYDLKYYRHCDYWIGITKGICDYLIAAGMPSQRVFHLPNFADEQQVVPIKRTEISSLDLPVVLAAGRLHHNKGFDTLIHAMSNVKQAQLWLAGIGPEEQKLKQLVQQLGLEDRVLFLGWREDVNALMQAADLFVCPSRHEGFGSIVVEAWLNGCPILATDSQGPKELIDSGVNGLLSTIDDHSELSHKIQLLLDEPSTRAMLAANGKQHYQNHYSKARVTARYLELFQELCH